MSKKKVTKKKSLKKLLEDRDRILDKKQAALESVEEEIREILFLINEIKGAGILMRKFENVMCKTYVALKKNEDELEEVFKGEE